MTPHPILPEMGLFIGRIWRPDVCGPSLVLVRDHRVLDITSREAPTMRDLLEIDDLPSYLASADGEDLGALDEIAEASLAGGSSGDGLRLLAPCDLQAVKASGVTFARSMVERVIEEMATGDASRADAIRGRVGGLIGGSLQNLVPGSAQAAEVKEALIREGLWSQYLEVGIGPDAEVFTKCQPMSAVGWGAEIGLHPMSSWNNPEPEAVLAVDSKGRVRGATLGNDVNLRDVEGRSALLLAKAKDNNASCAIGPFLRVFDGRYSLDDVRRAEIELRVEGEEGFVLEGRSSMQEISRDPLDIVAQTIGRHHQYPDGLLLFLGTMFVPIEDRHEAGEGFTHAPGDLVTISEPGLGRLRNTVRLSTECPEWTFGTGALMRNLAARGFL